MSAQIEPLLTINDLDAMPDDENRYEIIEGELLVSRAPSLKHQRISGNLFLLLRSYFDQNPLGEVIAAPGIVFDEFNGVIPDMVFISYERRDKIATGERILGAPELVIEIVSPGAENEKRDRVVKRQLYGKYGVKEYWIVDSSKRSIEVYLLEEQALKLKTEYTESDMLVSFVLPGFTCEVKNVFCY